MRFSVVLAAAFCILSIGTLCCAQARPQTKLEFVESVASAVGQARFQQMSEWQEAIEFLWTPGECIYFANASQDPGQYFEADYTILLRVPASGATDCLLVRYRVGPNGIRFYTLQSEPDFTVTEFPTYRNTLGAIWTAPDSTRLFNRHRKWDKTGTIAQTRPPLSFDNVHYEIELLLKTPRLFVPDRQPPTDQPAASGNIKPPRKRTYSPDGRLASETWKPAHALGNATIKYQYADGLLREIQATLPAIRYTIPVTSYFRASIEATEEYRFNIFPFDPSPTDSLSSVPVLYRPTPRNLNVQFSASQPGIPQLITLRPDDKNAIVSLVASATCVGSRTISAAEYEQEPEFLYYKRILELGQFRRKYQTEGGVKAVRKFKSYFEGENLSVWQRFGLHGKMLRISIFNNDFAAARQELAAYSQAARDLGLEHALPELLYPAFKRAGWSGTPEMYRVLLDAIPRECQQMDPEARFRSCLHLRTIAIAPYALFNMAFGGPEISFSEEDSAEVRMHGLYLAASLMPQLTTVMEQPLSVQPKSCLALEEVIFKSQMTEASLEEVSAQIRREARKSAAALAADARPVWKERFDAIIGWTQD